jgi:alkanesulfonate monooxygenase SsuD/methylene tetrahydromethanopterin reductase-like flavin-dependent oxidoreductase (luciferase family)
MTLISGQSKGGQIGGAKGYMPLSTNLVPPCTVTEHWDTYCRGAAEAGLPEPDRDIWRVSRSIFVGESTQEAWDFCMNSAFAGSFEYIIALLNNANMISLAKHDPDVPDSDVTVEYYLKHCCIIGDKRECIRQLEEFWDQTGGFGTLLVIKHDFDDTPKWQRSIQDLAEHVVPAMPSVKPGSNKG